jgi:hypothetical protein
VAGSALPAKVELDDLAYRKYLVWRGEALEDHYRRLQQRLKAINPNTVLMSWSVNAGRYGHFLDGRAAISPSPTSLASVIKDGPKRRFAEGLSARRQHQQSGILQKPTDGVGERSSDGAVQHAMVARK